MKDVLKAFLTTGVIQLINILSGIMLARILLVEGRGELAAATLWPTVIAALGTLAMHESITYHLSRRTAPGNTILYSAFAAVAGLSLVAAAAAFIAIDLALAGYRSDVVTAARYCIAFIPLNYIGLCLVGMFQGAMRLDDWNFLRAFVHVAYTALIGIFYLAEWGTPGGMVIAMLLANALLIVVAMARAAPLGWLRPTRPAAVRELAGFGLRAHAGSVVQALSERVDQMFISVMIGGAGLGLYVVGVTVARLVSVPAATLSSLALTKIANGASPEDRQALFALYLRVTFALVLVAMVLVIGFAGLILSVFFGTAFAEAKPIAMVLAVAMFLLGLKLVLSAGFKGLGRPLVPARGELAGLLCSVVSLASLMPLYGLFGAALAAVIAQAGGLVCMMIDGRRDIGSGWVDVLRPRAEDVRMIVGQLRALRNGRGGS
jgi:O-antigen/teichoic acid export membrane protein